MTNRLNLSLETGSPISIDELRGLSTPKGKTPTHFPLPHHELVDGVRRALEATGHNVVHEVHGTDRDHDRYFGLLQVEPDRSAGNLLGFDGRTGRFHGGGDGADHATIVGLRNGHDRIIPAGIGVGGGVFVCDNLSFSADIVVVRKHTRNAQRDLPALINRAVADLVEQQGNQTKRFNAYKSHKLTDSDANDLVIAALDSRVIGPQKIIPVLNEWRKPRHPDFEDRNAWSLFNAFTETLKGSSVQQLSKRTQTLHGIVDRAVQLAV